ncbi:CAP domain-containing protein [Strongyloides ratti]|nr:CAP domain-containing protein [Strongyloides ratti]CEF66062.1 CAP domain-containing protein [Strongyloides ratti]
MNKIKTQMSSRPITRSYSWNGETVSLKNYEQKVNSPLRRTKSWNKENIDVLAANRYAVLVYNVGGQTIYECNDFVFQSYNDAKSYSNLLLKNSLLNSFKKPKNCLYRKRSRFEVIPYEVNGEKIYECGIYGFFNYKDAKDYQNRVYSMKIKNPNEKPQNCVLKTSYKNDVTWYNVGGEKIYECGDYGFHNYADAKNYCRALKLNNGIDSIWRPKGYACESRRKLKEFDITDYLGQNAVGINVWKGVWHNYDYEYLSAHDFLNLAKKILQEINRYRKLHRSQPIKFNKKLTVIANRDAMKIALKKTLTKPFDSNLYGMTFGLSYYRAASTIVMKWYEESSYYSYNQNTGIRGTQMFTQMIWNKSIRLGIGIARMENLIIVVCRFWPKGNIAGEYRQNVLPLIII